MLVKIDSSLNVLTCFEKAIHEDCNSTNDFGYPIVQPNDDNYFEFIIKGQQPQ